MIIIIVGECILTQTNNNTIGSTIKLKDGAETEVARFQYQMGNNHRTDGTQYIFDKLILQGKLV